LSLSVENPATKAKRHDGEEEKRVAEHRAQTLAVRVSDATPKATPRVNASDQATASGKRR
jgi:hypothetical protein